MFPLNKKGLTLVEIMVVVIVIGLLVAMAFPTYISALEKARAQEAVRVTAHLVAAQEKFRAECYNMDPSTGVCGFATDFSRLPVQIAGPNEDINIQINPDSIRTGAFTYTMDISGNNVTITATPHRSGTYNYIITADSRTSQILCIVGAESGRKICSAIGTSLDDNDYLIN